MFPLCMGGFCLGTPISSGLSKLQLDVCVRMIVSPALKTPSILPSIFVVVFRANILLHLK